jgi:D-glycero-alpha-D-manno-heptose-7-phosphate kinase
MIISRTPHRVSFFGGGTDYPAWYETHGGCVLASSINRYCYLTCRYLPPFFAHRHRIVYSQIEATQTVDEIQHPAVRECLRFLGITEGVEIHHDGDLPKQSGLGTSSSFVVGLLHALHALRGEMRSRLDLAREAIHVERDLCRESVGSQDQVTAAFGGLNRIWFAAGDAVRVEPVTLSIGRLEEFQRHLMLFFTGFSRVASDLAKEQIANTPAKERELATLQSMVDEGLRVLTGGGDLRAFGLLLDEAWQVKRTLSRRISNERIDALYELARHAGASGGTLCGAGGGGFLLLFVEPDRQSSVRQALGDSLHVPFELDRSGSEIVFFQPDVREPGRG